MATSKRTALTLSEIEALINIASKESVKGRPGEPLSSVMDELAGLYGLMVFQKADIVQVEFLRSEYPEAFTRAQLLYAELQ